MCGIAGYFSNTEIAHHDELSLMTNAIKHRGPNAAGYYTSAHVGLGHRRLSIIDLSETANQPMYSSCGRYVIVFNGEIYNFKEIAQELSDYSFSTHSDTEVLLAAFIRWGTGFVHRLNGMFAFAIYDLKQECLYLYRDRMGIKPLYYFKDATRFVFASELKSLEAISSISKSNIDHQAINDFLYLGYIPSPNSIYQNIKKFPSGHFAVVKKSSFSFHSYWKLEAQIEQRPITDIDEAKNQLRTLLENAVKYRLISDVPFGTFLSGGIDSSLVTALAQQLAPHPVKTFSIGFKEAKFNEAHYAEKVAQHLGTEHHTEVLSYADALELLNTAIDIYDEPFADSSAFPTLLVSAFAKKHVTVILSGDGGDETHLGYGMYNWGKRLQHPLLKWFRKPLSLGLSLGNNRMKRAATLFNYPDAALLKSHIFSQEQYFFHQQEIQKLLHPAFVASFSIEENFLNTKRALSFVESQALFDLQYYLQDDLLVKVDRASMYHSLEVRVPLIDYNLVSFALNLEEGLRKKNDVSKFLLKSILYDMVPAHFFDRPKWGFSIPLVHWLKNEWRFLIFDYLSKEKIEQTGVLHYPVVKNYVDRFLKGEDYLYNRLWSLIVLQKFLTKRL